MATPPALLFDLDGTLIDSVYQHVLAWQEALTAFGVDLAVWKIHRRIGMSGGLFVNALVRETGGRCRPRSAASSGSRTPRRSAGAATPCGRCPARPSCSPRSAPRACRGHRDQRAGPSARPALALLGLPEDTPLVTRDRCGTPSPTPTCSSPPRT
jgi:hypothetical protein